jgi:hypothetical protein
MQSISTVVLRTFFSVAWVALAVATVSCDFGESDVYRQSAPIVSGGVAPHSAAPSRLMTIHKAWNTRRSAATAVTASSKSRIDALIAPALSRSSQGLTFERRRDGLTTVNFQGRFSHVMLARRMPDGTVKTGCFDGVKAAHHWLGVAPASDTDRRP